MSSSTTVAIDHHQTLDTRLHDIIERACARIAPTWPLDRFIAVNPFWGLLHTPLPEVAAKLQALSGAQLLMPRAWYKQAYDQGRLRDVHLRAACATPGAQATFDDLVALLVQDTPAPMIRSRVVDVVDAERDLVHAMAWRDFITHSISQHCAAHFDDGQAQLGPSRDGGLYVSWRRHATKDRSPALRMGATSYSRYAGDLPATARDMIALGLSTLDVPSHAQESYLWSLLLDQNGWASWCAYRRFTERLAGSDDDAIVDLLAIRLAWEWMLHRMGGDGVAQRFEIAMARWTQIDAFAATSRADDWLLQLAMEMAWREPVVRQLPAGFRNARPAAPVVQAVFCIDVRSEIFRRALEAVSPSVQTLGFAGFFGMPVDYVPVGTSAARPQLPGLLAPRLRVSDTGLGSDAAMQREKYFDMAATWKLFKSDALSTFVFVEAFGLTYAAKLIKDSLGLGTNRSIDSTGLTAAMESKRKPRLVSTAAGEAVGRDARCDLAAGILRGMSLTRNFARIVLLVGHGSSTRNNPHAAGLDCGACCGQTGEINARAAAALLNDPQVREGLVQRGIHVPVHTWFVAALHTTTTDDIQLFDTDEISASHADDLNTLREWLAQAGERARAERAPLLGLKATDPVLIKRMMHGRTHDWAQVRPEWGLANNAAFIVAPREHCQHVNLEGRSFLHEYRYQEDEGFSVLEGIMTAPMVVTHWINFQYYASTVDNERYGSGNKVLHNVVGGHLGVFEGNGGDLRIGLPMQSLHDGQQWVHTPLRLSVFIEAPREAIDAILAKHAHVHALVANGWLSIFQLDDQACAVYGLQDDGWHRCSDAV